MRQYRPEKYDKVMNISETGVTAGVNMPGPVLCKASPPSESADPSAPSRATTPQAPELADPEGTFSDEVPH